MADPRKQAVRRKTRVRGTIRKVTSGRARLSVFRSSKHIYAQVIDDLKGETIVSASSIEKDMRGGLKTGADIGPPRQLESCSPSGLRPKASRISSSIVAAINFTGASRLWLTRRARAD